MDVDVCWGSSRACRITFLLFGASEQRLAGECRQNQTPGLGPLLKAQQCGPRLRRPAEWGKGRFQPPETGENPAVTSVVGVRRGKAWASRTLRGRAARDAGGGILSRHPDPRRSCSITAERGRETGQEKDRPKGRERGEMASQMEFAEPLLLSLVTREFLALAPSALNHVRQKCEAGKISSPQKFRPYLRAVGPQWNCIFPHPPLAPTSESGSWEFRGYTRQNVREGSAGYLHTVTHTEQPEPGSS